ncbi:hypothetical protein [Synechocystis sp. LKSZ1]|uniref:hypothetical protein n=1 Tax=Synechocystis sp. LKSZ1 TaxID=3144951 RepID=UPI00336BC864
MTQAYELMAPTEPSIDDLVLISEVDEIEEVDFEEEDLEKLLGETEDKKLH